MLTTLKAIPGTSTLFGAGRPMNAWFFTTLVRICCLMIICLGLGGLSLPAQAKSDVFETSYFTVQLTNGWDIQGRPQNSERALNVNFINEKRNVRINIVVGSARVTPQEQLEQMQKAIRSQGGMVHQLRKRGNMNYFTFVIGQWPGFCYAGSNGHDLSIITAIGNRNDAARFVRSFTKRDESLFPSF